MSAMKALVHEALVENNFETQRSAKLGVDDFLRLLVSLTKRGIIFA